MVNINYSKIVVSTMKHRIFMVEKPILRREVKSLLGPLLRFVKVPITIESCK